MGLWEGPVSPRMVNKAAGWISGAGRPHLPWNPCSLVGEATHGAPLALSKGLGPPEGGGGVRGLGGPTGCLGAARGPWEPSANCGGGGGIPASGGRTTRTDGVPLWCIGMRGLLVKSESRTKDSTESVDPLATSPVRQSGGRSKEGRGVRGRATSHTVVGLGGPLPPMDLHMASNGGAGKSVVTHPRNSWLQPLSIPG